MNAQRRLSLLVAVGGSVVILGFVASICIPNRLGSHTSKGLSIVNNLRQIDGAIEQWALDNGKTGAVVVTWKDLAPYLKVSVSPDGEMKSVAGERYILKGLSNSPEAQLTRRLELWPRGTVLRLSTNWGFEAILPR